MKPWQLFLNSSFVLLVSGFVLTTILGGLLSLWFQRASWKRQTRVDLFRKRYEEGTQFLDELSDHIGKRFFALQRFVWSLQNSTEEQRANIEKEYFTIVAGWNARLRTYRNKIRLLVSEEQADRFLDYQDDYRPQDPQSLHYILVKAHNAVVDAKKGKIEIANAQRVVDELNWACSKFLEALTTSFLERATTLQLLEPPESRPDRPLRHPRNGT